MAAALGVRFTDVRGYGFVPCGGTLKEISNIDVSGVDKRVHGAKFTVMCDVSNPLYGPDGAAHVYGPQKGADAAQVLLLDEGLRRFSAALIELTGEDYADIPGAGAAGGLGAGCMAFLGAGLMRGSDAIPELCGVKKHLADADLIITGEGKLDSQSFSGKVLSGILRYAGEVPVWSVCGKCECGEELLRSNNVTVFEASEGISVEESMSQPGKYLALATRKAASRLMKTE